jgi:phage baseplate assembly protein W
MAQRIANRFPADLNKNQALGVGLPFNANAVFNQNFTTKDQTKSNLINFFLTNKGERPFRPNFGANLREDIFQTATESDYDLLKEKISFELSQNFPNINLDGVNIVGSEDLNTIKVTISYSIKSFGITDELNLTFE